MIIHPANLKVLRKFQKVAIEIINENDNIKKFARETQKHYAEIEPILNSDEFQNDLDTYVSIIEKHENEGIDIPKLFGYVDTMGEIGGIMVEGEVIYIDEEIFFCEEGLSVIMKIFDLLDIDYQCKKCLVRAACQKLNPDMDCEKVEDIMDGHHLQPLVTDILAKICDISQIRALEK